MPKYEIQIMYMQYKTIEASHEREAKRLAHEYMGERLSEAGYSEAHRIAPDDFEYTIVSIDEE